MIVTPITFEYILILHELVNKLMCMTDVTVLTHNHWNNEGQLDREVHENLIDNNEDILENVGRSASTLLMVDVTSSLKPCALGAWKVKKTN